MGSNYHVQFFGRGVDIYFQAQSSYQATPLFFQSMYIAFAFFRSFILVILEQFQVLCSLVLRLLFFWYIYIYIWVHATFSQYHYDQLMRFG